MKAGEGKIKLRSAGHNLFRLPANKPVQIVHYSGLASHRNSKSQSPASKNAKSTVASNRPKKQQVGSSRHTTEKKKPEKEVEVEEVTKVNNEPVQ